VLRIETVRADPELSSGRNTGIYQFVSDEFGRSTLRRALDRTAKEVSVRAAILRPQVPGAAS
jgi:hypothetical protein